MEVQGLYAENYKTLLREIIKDLNKGIPIVMTLKI